MIFVSRKDPEFWIQKRCRKNETGCRKKWFTTVQSGVGEKAPFGGNQVQQPGVGKKAPLGAHQV